MMSLFVVQTNKSRLSLCEPERQPDISLLEALATGDVMQGVNE